MKRTVLIFLGLLVLMVAAMIGITNRMLALERNEQRQALSAESERLALWRMESQLLPIVLEESSRDYDELDSRSEKLNPTPAHAICYFRCDSTEEFDLLWCDTISREKYDRYIETLKNEAERLEYLIENVLSWSRLERSAETQLIEDLDWDEFFERIESSLRDRVTQAGMTLEVSAAEIETPHRFCANRTAVERILFNLIDNACKYAKHAKDTRIHIELSHDERNIRIGIRDHGPGIAAEVRPRLFQPFTKSAKEAAGSAPGIGLGLSLSRRLARDLKGDLRLESSTSAGTMFELSLVRAR